MVDLQNSKLTQFEWSGPFNSTSAYDTESLPITLW